jgi:hypothetical protein
MRIIGHVFDTYWNQQGKTVSFLNGNLDRIENYVVGTVCNASSRDTWANMLNAAVQ